MKKSKGQLIAGLDIGSSFIRMAVGQVGDSGNVQIIGASEAPSKGVYRGTVNSIEDAVSSISSCLERSERMIGAPIEHVWVGISGSHVVSQNSKGVVAVGRSDGEIAEEDIERAVEAARTVATPLNHEILHVIPQTFSVDGQTGIKDPVGMTGVRLEVDTRIIQGVSSHIKNLTKAVYRTGLDIDNIVLSILATAEAVVTPRQKELGVIVVNLGSATTSFVVFEDGELIHTAVLPIGCERVTSDIAIGLRIDVDSAEQIKLACGTANPKVLTKKEEIALADFGGNGNDIVSRKYIAEIIEARVEEMLGHVDDQLKKIGRSGMLPGGVILTGGGAKLPGIVDVAKRRMRLPAALGPSVDVDSITDKVSDFSFSTAIGLVVWGKLLLDETKKKGVPGFKRFKSVDKAAQQVGKWLSSLLP